MSERSEAMACGMPTIGVRETRIRESVIDREPIQIAAAILRIQQKEMPMRMSRREVEDVLAQWRWEYTVDQYEEEVQKSFYTREHAPHGPLNLQVLPNHLRTNN